MLLVLGSCRQQAQLFLKDMQPVWQSYTFPAAGCVWLFNSSGMHAHTFNYNIKLKVGYCILMIYLSSVLSLTFQIATLIFPYFWSEIYARFLSDTSFLPWGEA